MNIERFRKIVEFSDRNRIEIDAKVKNFYAFADMSSDVVVRDFMQIFRPALMKKGYLLLEMPFADDEIGALCYRGDALGYIVLNTSLPKVNINFALCHEIYHAFYPEGDFRTRVEFANNIYCEQEEETAANLFAAMLLMPETSFRFMYTKFKMESEQDERDTIIRLMNYYQAPYMSVLLRIYELGLPDNNSISEELLNLSQNSLKEHFNYLWLDDSILCATKRDDSVPVQLLVERFGNEYVRESYMNQRTLDKVLQNMRNLCSEIKGE